MSAPSSLLISVLLAGALLAACAPAVMYGLRWSRSMPRGHARAIVVGRSVAELCVALSLGGTLVALALRSVMLARLGVVATTVAGATLAYLVRRYLRIEQEINALDGTSGDDGVRA